MPAPSRLLIVSFSVCPAPDRHGVGLLNVVKALASRYSVDVLTLRTAELPFVERFMKTRMLRVPVGQDALEAKVEAFRRAVRRQLEGEEYDAIHLRSAWGGRAVFAGLHPGRVVYEVARSTEGEPRAADELLAAALAEEEALCLERADLVLVPTASAHRHLLERDVDPARVVVVPPGVDVDHFDWEAEPSDEVPRVLYCGQIAGGRGVRLLCDALGRVRAHRPLKLILAGAIDAPFRPAVDEALAQAKLQDDVELLGAVDHDDMPRVIARANICVAPASPDAVDRPLAGFPTKLLEYMACRRAVVAPRRPSVEEVIEDVQDGLLFRPGDPADLARAIDRLLDDPALRLALAESGYRRVRHDFPASATRRRLLEVFSRVLPSAQEAPLGQVASSIDALPTHPDTTAQRAMPEHQTDPFLQRDTDAFARVDGRAAGELAGEIVIDDLIEREEPAPVEITIEAIDYEEAGEKRDATIEPNGANDLLPADAAVELAEGDPADDEKTIPGSLPPRRRSG